MKKYENYKDSNQDFLGKIPSHWFSTTLKRIVEVKDGTHDTPSYVEEDGIPFITTKDLSNGNISFENCKYISYDDYLSINKRSNVENGDIIMPMIGSIGSPIIVKTEKPFSIKNLALIKKNTECDLRYICYYLNSEATLYQFGLCTSGGVQNFISLGVLRNLGIPKMEKEEQTQIANYLDHKTTQIDTLITKKQQFISLLQEERTAVINQAVTKGLDPNVKMKDSGIEWLGEIPEHWISYRIDWVTNIVRGNTGFKKDELLENGEYVALQYGKTYKVDIVDDSFNFFVNSEFFKESQVVSKGDTILISTSETVEDLGHTCFYNNGNIGLLGGEQILLKPNRKVLYEKYLYQYARQFCLELKKYAKGLKVFRFNTTDLKQIFIAIPSIEEQIQIADFLDRETIRIDSLINKMEKEIVLLKEYKTALISEVVTGKVDVRQEILN